MSLVVDVLTGGVNNHETTSEAVNGIATDFITEGIVGAVGNTSGVAPTTGGYGVEAQGTPDMTVAVDAGTAYVTGTPSTQVSQTFRVKNSASANVTISANSSGSTKYDWIYISLDATKLNAPNSAGDDVATLVASRSSSASTDDGTPPTYGYPIAVVTVANGATSITNSMIRDVRTQSAVNAGASSGASTWTDTGYAFGTVTYNGNRSYTCVISNADVTGFLSNGMRLKMTRTVTAPTQCADLESGSSHYFSKTSPNKLTFTDDWSVMGWVKLESYTLGGIIGRRNANTEGWDFYINASGQVQVSSLRIAANNSSTTSYQSIPLNKWVHVAATTDLSGTSTLIYIDGVLVPSSTTVTGTCTALVQGTTALTVGAWKSDGSSPFDGKLAQVAVFGAVLSASTIRSYMSQGLSGSETNLLSAYSLNGVITDLNSTTPNDLTAQNSAVATATDTPFAGGATGTTEYGIITANSFSTNTTLTVQVPEGYAIPTSGGVSAVAYSTQDVPYGFPRNKDKWSVLSLFRVQTTAGANTTFGSYNGGGNAITIPVGAWDLVMEMPMFSSSTNSMQLTLSDTSITGNAFGSSPPDLTFAIQSPAASTGFNYCHRRKPLTLTSATTYVLYQAASASVSGAAGLDADNQLNHFLAEFNYV